MNDYSYFKKDIEKWLDANDNYFERGKSSQEYAENAVWFHNSKDCKDRCECINIFNQMVQPRLQTKDQKWFKKIARIKYNLESWVSKQYIRNIRQLHQSLNSGCLFKLNDLYEDYGRPKNSSPKRLLRERTFSDYVSYQIEVHDYRVEEVIHFDDHGVYANAEVGIHYLNKLDLTNHIKTIRTWHWFSESEFLQFICNTNFDELEDCGINDFDLFFRER